MAKKADEDTVVEVEDSGAVTVDVTDNPDLAAEPEKKADAEDKPEKRERKPRVKLDDDQQVVVQKPGDDEAAKQALAEAIKKADDSEKARQAAEATAIAERQRAEQAQRLVQQREQEAAGYKEQAEDSQLVIINNGIESAKTQLDAYQDEYARAAEAGEFKKMAEINVKIGKASAALDRFEDAKAQIESQPKKTTEGRVEAQTQQQGSAFEQYVSSPNFAPKAQAWLRAHPGCVPPWAGGDKTKNNKMMKGHYDALDQGLTEGSDDYFRVIEEHTGYRTPISAAAVVKTAGDDDTEVDEQPTKPVPKQKAAQVSAPATNAAAISANGQRTTRSVVLSKDEQDAARMSFPQLPEKDAFAQYARNKIELEAEGKLGRLTH